MRWFLFRGGSSYCIRKVGTWLKAKDFKEKSESKEKLIEKVRTRTKE